MPFFFVDLLSEILEGQHDSGAVWSNHSIPASPASSLVSFGNETQAPASSAMTSYIVRLLETAITAGYDQYGIPGSPTGSLISVDDAAEATSGCPVSSSPSTIPIDHSIYRFVVY
jgi:hypothetical protein